MPPLISNAVVAVQRTELAEQRLRLGESGARWRIEECELFGCAAPGCKVQGEGRQIGGEDFGLGKRFERNGLRLVPEPVADSRLGPARASAALIGRGTRDPHGFEPRQLDVWLVARNACET